MDELLTRAEAAQYLKVSLRTLDTWVKADKIKPLRLPSGHYRFTREGLLRQLGLEPQND
jgi:excisionase family DNA binding protein